jgi:NAD(P)-dependent dehydrogenase (short-subunit alcohol dehydrogenase family)
MSDRQARKDDTIMASDETMKGRVCLVTGATSGIGKVTAQALAGMGATVIVVGRNQTKARAVVDEIRQATGNTDLELFLADLSVQQQVRALAEAVLTRYPHIHVLINNAGAVYRKRSLSADGIEMTFAVNHLAYFLLTNLLLDRLKADAPARIVNVASDAHKNAKIPFDDLNSERHYRGFKVYGQTKLANILFTYELARRLKGSGVTANCLHPGLIATGFGHNDGGLLSLGLRLVTPFIKKPEQGAETSIYLASSPEVEGVSGQYFVDKKSIKSSPASYDEDAARRLWEISAAMTGVG